MHNHLSYSTLSRSNFEYRPDILCVGKNISLNFDMFLTSDSNKPNTDWSQLSSHAVNMNKHAVQTIYEKNMVDMDMDSYYVRSVGVCKGDSGGPMFVKSR